MPQGQSPHYTGDSEGSELVQPFVERTEISRPCQELNLNFWPSNPSLYRPIVLHTWQQKHLLPKDLQGKNIFASPNIYQSTRMGYIGSAGPQVNLRFPVRSFNQEDWQDDCTNVVVLGFVFGATPVRLSAVVKIFSLSSLIWAGICWDSTGYDHFLLYPSEFTINL
jgi:hypothetical protein